MKMHDCYELPTGTREADSFLENEEWEYYNIGHQKGYFEAVATGGSDGSGLLLSDRVWARSGGASDVEMSRRDVRSVIARSAEGRKACELAAESEESGETPEWRFERLATALTERIIAWLLQDAIAATAIRFLQDGANKFARRTSKIDLKDVTSGLDVSTYKYDLRYSKDLGHFSGQFPVDVAQHDAMMERAKWLERLEKDIAARVLIGLEREFASSGIDFSNLNLEVKLLEDGTCSLNASPKNTGTMAGGMASVGAPRSPRT